MTENIIVNNLLENCRICKSTHLTQVISLGEQYITSRFPKYGDWSTPKTNIDLCLCGACGLLQLQQTTASSELYEYEYGYRSGINNMMRTHLKEYQEQMMSIIDIQDGDVVIDIGSNDSTLLQYYPSTVRRIGVDPTGNQFREYYGDVELIPTYFTKKNVQDVVGDQVRCKVISSISMFYDLPDPVQFACDVYDLLDDDGIWTCEQSYLPTMVNTNSIDTICHEHLEYYGLHQIQAIAHRAKFNIIDVKFNACNGGSFRVYFAKIVSTKFKENTEVITPILDNELRLGTMTVQYYHTFMENCQREIQKLCDFVQYIQEDGKHMYVYGASTKGNCLLQYANLGEKHMKYAVERNPKKVGKMTCTGIEIIDEETMRINPPDYLLVLPWHFRDEIVVREEEFLRGGGQLVFPFPRFEIKSHFPKALITGCDGFIGKYVVDRFIGDHTLYGMTRKKTMNLTRPVANSSGSKATFRVSSEEATRSVCPLPKLPSELVVQEAFNPPCQPRITKMYLDMTDYDKLEKAIVMLNPDVLIHLAGMSSSQQALKQPIDAVVQNGMIPTYICEILHRHNMSTRLFHATSSEMYKGFGFSTVDDSNETTLKLMYHAHPYSAAKIMSQCMVDFYRTNHHKHYSTGILFTVESPKKGPEFLLQKVASHIRTWTSGEHNTLLIGHLNSCRNIIHPTDVADAIRVILYQDTANTYVIANEDIIPSIQMSELVQKMYSKAGIEISIVEGNKWIDKASGDTVLMMSSYMGVDTTPTNIRGVSYRLNCLGWKPQKTIDDILDEYISFIET
uniref:GDP-mannose 4,6-dehydratase n=1 Tax=viral metagenome TaxID=1070528 RepID=A0A6C0IBQ1_9ZZZZ